MPFFALSPSLTLLPADEIHGRLFPSESRQTEHYRRSAPFTHKLELRYASVYHFYLNTRERRQTFLNTTIVQFSIVDILANSQYNVAKQNYHTSHSNILAIYTHGSRIDNGVSDITMIMFPLTGEGSLLDESHLSRGVGHMKGLHVKGGYTHSKDADRIGSGGGGEVGNILREVEHSGTPRSRGGSKTLGSAEG